MTKQKTRDTLALICNMLFEHIYIFFYCIVSDELGYLAAYRLSVSETIVQMVKTILSINKEYIFDWRTMSYVSECVLHGHRNLFLAQHSFTHSLQYCCAQLSILID